jgi:hypothetical protein
MIDTHSYDTAARRIPFVRRGHSLNIYPAVLQAPSIEGLKYRENAVFHEPAV